MRVLSMIQLEEGMVVAANAYPAGGKNVPVAVKGTVLTWRLIAKLQDHGVTQVSVQDHSVSAHRIVQPSSPVIDDKLKGQALENIEELFSSSMPDETGDHKMSAFQVVKQVETVVDQLIQSLSRDSKALINISNLKSYDEYTYHHSLSVAVLAIAIGQNMGMHSQELSTLGRCAIMHDIGKTAIPIEIINKPSRLSEKEFEIIKEHAAWGYQYLYGNKIGDDAFWRSVLCHHEKIDGSGYPLGLTGNEIPLMSRIISVADVYDALTSHRPYRRPMEPSEVVEYLMGGVGSAFDHSIVTAFLHKLELYPVGSFIELSNGEIAVVLDNGNSLRPVVRSVETGEIFDLAMDRNCLSLTIQRTFGDKFPRSA